MKILRLNTKIAEEFFFTYFTLIAVVLFNQFIKSDNAVSTLPTVDKIEIRYQLSIKLIIW